MVFTSEVSYADVVDMATDAIAGHCSYQGGYHWRISLMAFLRSVGGYYHAQRRMKKALPPLLRVHLSVLK